MHGVGTTPETLLYLSWASRLPGLPEELEQITYEKREQLLRNRLVYALPPVFEQDALYGPLFQKLFTYRLNQVEFLSVGWALRGYESVYLKKAAEEPSPENAEDSLSGETALFWGAITANAHLRAQIEHLGRAWDEVKLHQGARLLRLHFTSRLPALLRQCPFLVKEFLCMSLERVDWLALAARVRGVPSTPLPPLLAEEEEDEDPVVQLAALKAAIWNGYNEFGELSLQPQFSSALRDLSSDLADQCYQTHRAIGALEEAGEVFTP